MKIGDLRWRRTLPHIVTPLQDEWLLGLLWRCDKENGWPKNTAKSMCLLYHTKRGGGTPSGSEVSGEGFDFDELAELLAVPTQSISITETTFRAAHLRLTAQPSYRYTHFWQGFNLRKICPACISEARLLQISIVLPHIYHCHVHQLVLQKHCSCGASFASRLGFTPFTCHKCGLDWKNLPRIPAEPQHLADERRYFSLYSFFLTEATWLDFERIYFWLNEEYSMEYLNSQHAFGGESWQAFFLRHFPSSVWQARHELYEKVSLAQIIRKLADLGASLHEVTLLAKSLSRHENSCLNHACPLFGVTEADNVAQFGYYQLPFGKQEPIWYCKVCGSCYHNHRLCFTFDLDCFGHDSPTLYPSQFSISRARWHLEISKVLLNDACDRMAKQGKRIGFQEALEEAHIPWKPNLLAPRLGLVEIVETYARLQQNAPQD